MRDSGPSKPFYTAKQTADICCNHIIPEIERKELVFTRNSHRIRDLFIDHDIHSHKMGSMKMDGFGEYFRECMRDRLDEHMIYDLFHSLEQEMSFDALSWLNMTHCVRHAMYPKLASTMDSVLGNMNEVDSGSLERVIEELKAKGSVTNKELDHIQELVGMARDAMCRPPNLRKC